jgi:hypothetical protein
MTENLPGQTVPSRAGTAWPSIAVAIVFGLLYAYVLWTAIGNLIALPPTFGAVTPWWLLILDAVLPVAVFVVAFLIGRRRPLLHRALLFFLGLAVLSCETIASIAWVQTHFGLV